MAELGAGSGSSYPTSLDSNSVVEVDSPATGKTKVRADVPNDLAAAIIAVQTELGTDPAGTKADVKTFFQTDHQTSGKHFHLITKSSDYTTVSSDNWGMFRVDTSSGSSCESHFAGLPPQISQAPSTPRLFNPPQEPDIGALPRITPIAIAATTARRMTNVKTNSIIVDLSSNPSISLQVFH